MSDAPSMNDERYRIPGTTVFNFTAWSRENDPKEPPKFWLGHRVLYTDDGGTYEATVTNCYPDCDYTPLYDISIAGVVHRGVSDANLAAAPEDNREDAPDA